MVTPTTSEWPEASELSDAEPVTSSGVWCETDSARAVVRRTLEDAVGQLETELPRAREGVDPEGVHQARVACRRIRSDLRTFAPLLVPEQLESVRAGVAWFADALGGVRDLDVLAEGLTAAAAEVGIDAGGLNSLLDDVDRRREAARVELLAVLDSPRAATVLATLAETAADPPTTLAALGRAEHRLLPLIRAPWRKLVRLVEKLDREPRIDDLHRIRLQAKRTRYAAEAVGDVFGKPARRFTAAVADVQRVLGDMNDAEAAIGHLRNVAATLDVDGAFAAGQLVHHFQLIADDGKNQWQRPFERARRRGEWLG